MGKKLAIQGHSTRGKEVIELLEMLGGTNPFSINDGRVIGNRETSCYYISEDIAKGYISWDYIGPEEIDKYKIFTLEEFLEKYPFKVGDKVTLDNKLCTITWMCWECNTIYYQVQEIGGVFIKKVTADELKPYKEKNTDEGNHQETLETKVLGYTVDDVIFTNDAGWIRITNKLWDCYAEEHVYEGIGIINGREYKDIHHHNVTGKMQLGQLNHCKDVDDVRHVNSITDDIMINQITNKVSVIKFKPDVCDNKIELQLGDYEIEVRDGRTYVVNKKPKYPKLANLSECKEILGEKDMYQGVSGYKGELLTNFQRLLIFRNAYWKIAGEEMRLGKPWKPNWNDLNRKYFISLTCDGIGLYDDFRNPQVLAFPTEEMRDVFYENFRDLIEQCKELL